MRDIQAEPDDRGIGIDNVGITNLRLPSTFSDGHIIQTGIAKVEMTVSLQADRRGTHMSRLVQLAGERLTEFDPRESPITIKALRTLLDAPQAAMTYSIPVSVTVTAPASGLTSSNVIDLTVAATGNAGGTTVTTTVAATTTSLCPCSKEISDYGAHNQRSLVTVTVEGADDNPYPFSTFHIYNLISESGSCPVVPLLKRPDERHVTMRAYDNPAFVEDIIRTISGTLREHGLSHGVRVLNLESIHEHDAVAIARWQTR